jgi:putative SOS response-associated peptidase YedK
MCGRFTLRTSPQVIAEIFGLSALPELEPRYNVAPTQSVAAVRHQVKGPGRELVWLRWGLVPAWADDPSIGNRMINARAETAASKPAFRAAFKSRRCLIVADGFYEWQSHGGKKQPFFIGRKDQLPFGLAGLWEHWEHGGQELETCTILTTEANSLLQPLHDRMPVIVPEQEFELWLDPAVTKAEQVEPILRPYPAGEMTAYPVNPIVNSPRNDVPACLEKVG